MKNFSDKQLREYLEKITDEALYAYNVYQIEGEGRNLFTSIDGDENTIMGLPIIDIKKFWVIINEKIFSHWKSNRSLTISKIA